MSVFFSGGRTLLSKGIINSSEIAKPVLVWRENEVSDFLYEPLLVDNGFVDRVDKIKNNFTNH